MSTQEKEQGILHRAAKHSTTWQKGKVLLAFFRQLLHIHGADTHSCVPTSWTRGNKYRRPYSNRRPRRGFLKTRRLGPGKTFTKEIRNGMCDGLLCPSLVEHATQPRPPVLLTEASFSFRSRWRTQSTCLAYGATTAISLG